MGIYDLVTRANINPVQIRKLYDEKLTDSEIANKLDISDSSVRAWRKTNDLPANPRQQPEKTSNGAAPKALPVPTGTPVCLQKCTLPHKLVDACGAKMKKAESHPDYSQIETLYKKGYSDSAIQFELNLMSDGVVARWRERNNLSAANQVTLETVKRQRKHNKIEIEEQNSPAEDPESLYGNDEFLEEFIRKKLTKKKKENTVSEEPP